MADSNNDVPRPEGFPQENKDGSPALVGMSDYTRHLLRNIADKTPVTVVGGNYADLQRIGEQVAGGPGVKSSGTAILDVIGAPPGVDPKDDSVVTAPQAAAARGEWDRETERTGLLDAPPQPDPPENTDPTPVDPGSQSPTVEAKGGRTQTTQAQSAQPTQAQTPPKK